MSSQPDHQLPRAVAEKLVIQLTQLKQLLPHESSEVMAALLRKCKAVSSGTSSGANNNSTQVAQQEPQNGITDDLLDEVINAITSLSDATDSNGSSQSSDESDEPRILATTLLQENT